MKSLLTPAEKLFLQTILKPYKGYGLSIMKYTKNNKVKLGIALMSPIQDFIELPINKFTNCYQFKGLEMFMVYDLKTLSL